MNTQISTKTISFYGSELITLKVGDVIYTAVKPIVEALGLSWGTQKRKLIEQKEKFSWVHMNSTGSDGKTYEMLCMPIRKLNGWLFSINPEKVRPDLKDRVIKYQEECFEALYNYWFKGKAEREIDTITPEEQRMIQNAVTATHQRTGMSYGEIWSRVKNKFGVAKYEQIKRSDHHSAMIYIASMPIVNQPLLINGRNLEETLSVMVELYGYCLHAYEMQEKLSQHPDLADRIDSKIGGQYLHNLKHPLENAMTKAKRFIRNNSEKLTIIKAVDHLLN